MSRPPTAPIFFFFNDAATTEIYTLPLHDAFPISTVSIAPVFAQPIENQRSSISLCERSATVRSLGSLKTVDARSLTIRDSSPLPIFRTVRSRNEIGRAHV